MRECPLEFEQNHVAENANDSIWYFFDLACLKYTRVNSVTLLTVAFRARVRMKSFKEVVCSRRSS